jgi:hypothetical protein
MVRSGGSAREAIRSLVCLVVLSVPALAIYKAVYEHGRWERHLANETVAKEIMREFASGEGSKAFASMVWPFSIRPFEFERCLNQSVDDWSPPSKGKRDEIVKFMKTKRDYCYFLISKSRQQSASDNLPPAIVGLEEVDRYEIEPEQYLGESSEWIEEPTDDPCAGYNSCVYAPDGAIYGQDWINGPGDELGDGR